MGNIEHKAFECGKLASRHASSSQQYQTSSVRLIEISLSSLSCLATMKIVGFLGIKPMLCRDMYIQVIAEAPLSNSFFSLVLMGIIRDALEGPFSVAVVAIFLTEVIAVFKVVLGVVITRIFIVIDLVLLFLFHTLLIFKFAGFVALLFLERL